MTTIHFASSTTHAKGNNKTACVHGKFSNEIIFFFPEFIKPSIASNHINVLITHSKVSYSLLIATGNCANNNCEILFRSRISYFIARHVGFLPFPTSSNYSYIHSVNCDCLFISFDSRCALNFYVIITKLWSPKSIIGFVHRQLSTVN